MLERMRKKGEERLRQIEENRLQEKMRRLQEKREEEKRMLAKLENEAQPFLKVLQDTGVFQFFQELREKYQLFWEKDKPAIIQTVFWFHSDSKRRIWLLPPDRHRTVCGGMNEEGDFFLPNSEQFAGLILPQTLDADFGEYIGRKGNHFGLFEALGWQNVLRREGTTMESCQTILGWDFRLEWFGEGGYTEGGTSLPSGFWTLKALQITVRKEESGKFSLVTRARKKSRGYSTKAEDILTQEEWQDPEKVEAFLGMILFHPLLRRHVEGG